MLPWRDRHQALPSIRMGSSCKTSQLLLHFAFFHLSLRHVSVLLRGSRNHLKFNHGEILLLQEALRNMLSWCESAHCCRSVHLSMPVTMRQLRCLNCVTSLWGQWELLEQLKFLPRKMRFRMLPFCDKVLLSRLVLSRNQSDGCAHFQGGNACTVGMTLNT